MRILPAIALSALLVTAGCTGLVDSGPPADTASPAASTAGATDEPLKSSASSGPTGCGAPPVNKLPGVNDGQLTSLETLTDAHEQRLLAEPGVVVEHRITHRTNRSVPSISEVNRTATTRVASPERWVTRDRSVRLTGDGEQFQYASMLYMDREGGIHRDITDERGYEYRAFAPGAYPPPVSPDPETLGQFYRRANFTFADTVTRDGERLYLFIAGDSRSALAFPVTEQREHFRMLVTPCGQIEELSLGLTAVDANRSVQVRFGYEFDVRTTPNVTVETPEWVTDRRSENTTTTSA